MDYYLEKKENIAILTINMPGFDKSNITLKSQGKKLMINAKSEKREIRKEFLLDNSIDIDNINSKLKLGQLIIELPFKSNESDKIITIQ